MKNVIIVLILGIVIIIVDYVVQKVTAPATCGLATAYILPDYCTGACPAGSSCGATAVAPYGPGGVMVQDAACGCVPIIPPPTPPAITPPVTPPSGTPPSSTPTPPTNEGG